MPDPCSVNVSIESTSKPVPPLDSATGLVPISAERLQKLEELEAALPAMIELANAEYKKSNLTRLHEKDKTDPESVKLRVYRYVQKHKEKINERRREKRKEKKEAAAAAAAAVSAINEKKGVNRYADLMTTGACGGAEKEFAEPIHRIGVDGVTVRFDE